MPTRWHKMGWQERDSTPTSCERWALRSDEISILIYYLARRMCNTGKKYDSKAKFILEKSMTRQLSLSDILYSYTPLYTLLTCCITKVLRDASYDTVMCESVQSRVIQYMCFLSSHSSISFCNHYGDNKLILKLKWREYQTELKGGQ